MSIQVISQPWDDLSMVDPSPRSQADLSPRILRSFVNLVRAHQPSYLIDPLSLRLVREVEARINVMSLYSQWWPTVTWILNTVLTVANLLFHH